jgi:hypothetical protein
MRIEAVSQLCRESPKTILVLRNTRKIISLLLERGSLADATQIEAFRLVGENLGMFTFRDSSKCVTVHSALIAEQSRLEQFISESWPGS